MRANDRTNGTKAVTLHIVDVSRHQVERPDPLDLVVAKAAGFTVVNIQLDRGRQDDILPAWAVIYAGRARELGMEISTYRWLDGRLSGAESARRAHNRMVALGGPQGMAHAVDCEETPDKGLPASGLAIEDYVDAMQNMLGRPIALYSGRWWWNAPGRRWHGVELTPYLWSAPMTGYLDSYPGDDDSDAWRADYGGWDELSIMQYTVKPLPGTGLCSMSAIRDLRVWDALTGGAVAWYLNTALTKFRTAVNAAYSARDFASDGTIGDTAHAGTSSDHNPDPAGQVDAGSVDAWDMDVDLTPGRSAAADIEALKRLFQAHPSSAYWIHNDQICKRSTGWKRESYAYAGANRNRHTAHVHWNTRESHENSSVAWVIDGGGAELTGEEKIKLHVLGWFMQNGVIAQMDPVTIPALSEAGYGGATVPNKLAQKLAAITAAIAAGAVDIDLDVLGDDIAAGLIEAGWNDLTPAEAQEIKEVVKDALREGTE